MAKTRLFFILAIFFVMGIFGCSNPAQTNGISANGITSTPTRIVVRILDLDVALTALPTSVPAPSPLPPTPVILPSATSAPLSPSHTATVIPTQACTNRAEFVKHLTITDNTALEPGQVFMKQWRIKNIGTCVWSIEYSLIFYSGESMGGPSFIALPKPVQPGETIDLQVPMIAPLNNVTYTGNWVLKDALGNMFGFGEMGDRPIEVTIFVKPTPHPTPG
jgi:hypothetical protein